MKLQEWWWLIISMEIEARVLILMTVDSTDGQALLGYLVSFCLQILPQYFPPLGSLHADVFVLSRKFEATTG